MYKVDFEEEVKPKIQTVITEIIKKSSSKLEQREKSFEMFVFRIILDSWMNPWVVDVSHVKDL